jgi:hypothetical protein
MKTLSILPPDKSHSFYSPLDAHLIRTGVIADGSCFFHALLYATSSHYRNMDKAERIAYVQKTRNEIADSFTVSRWKQLGGGEMFRMMMFVMLDQHIKDDDIMTELSSKWTTTSLKDCCKILSQLTDKDVKSIIKQCVKNAFEQLKEHIRTAWVDEYCLEYISSIFQYNFYFVRADTRNAYKRCEQSKYRLSLIFCWISDSHYEIIGRMYDNGMVLRLFDTSDKLIEGLKLS